MLDAIHEVEVGKHTSPAGEILKFAENLGLEVLVEKSQAIKDISSQLEQDKL